MTFQLTGSGPEIYEKVLVPLWFGRWAEALVDLVDPKPADRVLDVACGTGVTTRLVQARLGSEGRIDGLDINRPMLDRARALAEGLGIGWIESDVCGIDLPAASYDLILSQHGYHYFPDKPCALRRLKRLLVPGGRLAFSIWDGHSAYTKALCAAVARHMSPEVAAQQSAQRATPGAAELKGEVSAEGFGEVEVHRQVLQIDVPLPEEFVPAHLGSMPIAAAFEALPAVTRRALIADVAEALGDHVQGDRVIYSDAVHVVTARA